MDWKWRLRGVPLLFQIKSVSCHLSLCTLETISVRTLETRITEPIVPYDSRNVKSQIKLIYKNLRLDAISRRVPPIASVKFNECARRVRRRIFRTVFDDGLAIFSSDRSCRVIRTCLSPPCSDRTRAHARTRFPAQFAVTPLRFRTNDC